MAEIHDGNFFFRGFCGGKHGNPVTREEGSALFKEARDVSKYPLSSSRSPFNRLARAIVTYKRDISRITLNKSPPLV